MVDRFLSVALNVVIVTLISTLSAAALACAHWGALRLLNGTWGGGGALLISSAALTVASWMLIRNRNDLVDR